MKTDVLVNLADRSGKTREEIADLMNITRMSLYKKLKFPTTMTFDEIVMFSNAVNKKPRHIFSLISSVN